MQKERGSNEAYQRDLWIVVLKSERAAGPKSMEA